MKTFRSVAFACLAMYGFLSLAGSNRAADADSQTDALKRGAQLWTENCTMCHEVKPRMNIAAAKLDAIIRHMREEADLSQEEQEALLSFLKSGD